MNHLQLINTILLNKSFLPAILQESTGIKHDKQL